MSDELSIRQRLEALESGKGKRFKEKELKLPSRAKVKGSKLRKGWVGILKIDENGNITPTKKQIDGSVFDFNKDTFHATDRSEILYWKGKFPVILQPTWKRNPINFFEGENETYGDKYVLAKMMKEVIKATKKAMGGGFLIVLIIAAAIFILGKFVFKWF